MFVARIKRVFSRLGLRIMVCQALAFALCMAILFVSTRLLMSTTLKKKDHELIQAKESALALRYDKEGIEGVRRTVESQGPEDDAWLFARIEMPGGKTVFLHVPQDSQDFNIRSLEQSSTRQKHPKEWLELSLPHEENVLEIYSERLRDGSILQVGRNSDDRERAIDLLENTFLILIFPILLLALIGGYFVSSQALKPIRHLLHTLKDLRGGDMSARLEHSDVNDEVGELSRVFNQMIERIQSLLTGMRRTLNDVAHDLRTPMTRFKGTAEKALQSQGDLRLYQEALEECVDSSDRILTLVDTLLDIAEAKSGSLQLKYEALNLRSLVDEIVDLYGIVAEEVGIGLESEIQEDAQIHGDPRYVRRAVGNLVDNAIKYGKPGGHVWITVVRDAQGLGIRVTDDGIGIPEQELPRIWTRLYRVDESRSRRGLGLGLTLVKAIAQAHGGRVSVESSPGQGSQFELWLPRESGTKEGPRTEARSPSGDILSD